MNIREIENNIIEKLKDTFPNILVQGFPDKPSEFLLLHSIGALLVHYQGSTYSNTDALGFVSQENKKEFSITVVTRNLRTNDGAYELIDKIKSVLTGLLFSLRSFNINFSLLVRNTIVLCRIQR